MTRKQDRNRIKHFCPKCHCNTIILQGLSVYVVPSVDNQDKAFLENWHENLQSFSLTLMSQVITFYDQTISKVNEEIEKSSEKKKMRNYTQNLTETKVKRLFLHLKRIMNSTVFT